MPEKQPSLFSLSRQDAVKLLKASGAREMSLDVLAKHIEEGFPPNDDGTIDLFDYATWLVGEKMDNPPPRTPPTSFFDLHEVYPREVAGWLNLYNHLGMEVPPSRVERLQYSYHFRFGAKDNPKKLDFLKFVAFLITHRPNKPKAASPNKYLEHKADMARRSKEAAAIGRDIGDLPAVADPDRKENCRLDFKSFCESYFPEMFHLEWSEDHLRCIAKIEESVLEGGLFALALPRGMGKSSLCETAAIWAILYGHRQFIVLIGATEMAALEILGSIKTEIETNELLLEDFPEACYPIAQLEGITNRCAGQTYHGDRTRITWSSNELVMPTIKGSPSSSATVRVAGITGRIRGMKYKRPDGRTVRPQLVIVDDPQTRESARSLEQNKLRLKILSGDILGLAGPGQKISGVMPCTIIEPGDMADTILDRDKHPEWQGEKSRMLYAMPENMALWDEYAEIRAECLREGGDMSKATDFYAERREAMDRGAVAAWPARFEKNEISAIQNAMNLYFRDPVAFASEYQNEPLKDDLTEESILTADAIASKLNGLEKGRVPLECTKITMFVDVQKNCLFYAVCAWSDEFSGAVLEYGAWPEQKKRRFTLDTASPNLQELFPHASVEARLYSAFTALFKDKMAQVYVREDGLEMSIDKAAIDANWGVSTDIVYQFCRQTEFQARVQPAHGHYVGASSRPMSEYRKKPGEKLGLNWYVPSVAGKRAIRHVVFDTNFWKTFVHSRLGVPIGDAGCLSLFGRTPLAHELYAEHLTAEYRVKTSGRGRVVDEWRLRPDRSDNHWLDCTVGCAMLASMLGSALPETLGVATQRKTVRLSEARAEHPQSSSPQIVPLQPQSQPKARVKLSALKKI